MGTCVPSTSDVSEIAACLLIVLVGCLGWLWTYEQIGFMNMLLKQNSFICRGLTVLLTILFNMVLERETDTTAVSERNPCSEHCEEWDDWWLVQRCETRHQATVADFIIDLSCESKDGWPIWLFCPMEKWGVYGKHSIFMCKWRK